MKKEHTYKIIIIIAILISIVCTIIHATHMCNAWITINLCLDLISMGCVIIALTFLILLIIHEKKREKSWKILQ